MIGTLGDLVEDLVVRLSGPVNIASDTDAVIRRRRGGSAANTAVAVVRAGGRARFIGQVGDEAIGAALVSELAALGVEPVVRRGGRTGTIVAPAPTSPTPMRHGSTGCRCCTCRRTRWSAVRWRPPPSNS